MALFNGNHREMGKVIIIPNHRACWNCNRALDFREFYNTNSSIYSEAEAYKLWNSAFVEFYCCKCYHEKVLKKFPDKKILLLGIQNTGKTSLIKAIKDRSLEHIENLLPTRGKHIFHFMFPRSRFHIWDTGGVESYRRRLLNNWEMFFSEVSELIYTINIQNPEMLDTSLHYLKKILEVLTIKEISNAINSEFEFLILFTKCDKNIKNTPTIQNRIENLVQHIKELEIPHQYQITECSVYNFAESNLQKLQSNEEISHFTDIICELFESCI